MTKFDPTSLKFNDAGLLPAIAQQHDTGEVLMLAWMNAQAVAMTLETGQVTYWSRSRSEFWVKGKTSGHTQRLIDMRIDCDRDCILVLVDQTGAACHTNRRNCFYTSVLDGEEVELLKPMNQPQP
ncbi:phosphoribosyl-AMP cyclohydrolase [Amylibacter sp. IMCC11727]|uniref:phosphoribosyl-AMP cyclohydrolase n=1 Tax=Amylibacter sp. IMCC11727 TaxID=3039851 RepID=UPI00244DC4C6|nr:phosphoribosyl-AMP cyclohydrolase [Amylibacter sp. IMCC11727]WGI20435.1 phosphoribosyl-AMP cyclohydrolase [Amylibacter sp. IMCC11727]